MYNKVVLIGVGLIGSSIGMNLVKKRLAREVIGVGRDPRNLREAVRRRAIHRFVGARFIPPLLANLTEKDLVILAGPVKSIIRYLKILPRRPLVTDVGSTKRSIVRAATERRIRFVGSHPIAGTERSGAEAGEIGLFQGRRCIVTPAASARKKDLQKIRLLWKKMGSETILMSPKTHDRLLAAVSHLPHAVAYTLVKTAAGLIPIRALERFSLGGFKDTTRIAASSPLMWRDIFLENRRPVLKAIDRYLLELGRLRSTISDRNSQKLLRILKNPQRIRQKIS